MALAPDLSTAQQIVRTRVKASGTSFGAGMMLLPAARRDAMHALYAFCREVDDIADDSGDHAARMAKLAAWRGHIDRLFKGQPDHVITVALQPAMQDYALLQQDFLDIIAGMEMDAAVDIRAPWLTELDLYCDRVASAVGRVSVRIFGDAGEAAMKTSHHLGRALQLTNIIRDVAEDAERGRLYLPREILRQNGIITAEPKEVLWHPMLNMACRDVAQMAEIHYAGAQKAMAQCSRAALRPARIMGAYYRAILKELKRVDWQNPRLRVRLGPWHKFWLLILNIL